MTASEPAAARAAIEGLVRWADGIGRPVAAHHAEKLRVFLETLLLWNRSVALVARQDVSTIAIKHFADCWFAATEVGAASGSVVDLGSGAGFPGLIVAIANAPRPVALVESVGKKANFLREVVRSAGVANAAVIEQRAELVGRDASHRGAYAVATARALGSLSELLTLAAPLVASGGLALAMKGPAGGSELESTRPESVGFKFESRRDYVLSDHSERTVLTFRRT